MPCSNAPKTRNPLKFAGVPQTRQQISAVSRPKFTILSGHVEEVLLLNKFFYRLSIHALIAKIWPDKVVRWCRDGDFLRPVFAESRVQRISDLHSKFAVSCYFIEWPRRGVMTSSGHVYLDGHRYNMASREPASDVAETFLVRSVPYSGMTWIDSNRKNGN